MKIDRIPILMYHSISEKSSGTEGPTCLTRTVFAAQMQAIADTNWQVISLAEFASWYRGELILSRPSLVITFDDGFADFAENAYPVLAHHGYTATVFLPTQRMGRPEHWAGANEPARALMDWSQVQSLSTMGISFAPHSRTHANLARLAGTALQDEVLGAADDLLRQLPHAPRHFAPPYGAVNHAALELIGRTYDLSVGVDLGIATRSSPLHNLPRLEMFYYEKPERFAALLNGRGETYLRTRQALRAVRRLMPHLPKADYA